VAGGMPAGILIATCREQGSVACARKLCAGTRMALSDPAYLPREVFFGRLGLAGPFFSVSARDFGRFFPATSAPSADPVIATE
jgi:hypothetical protein